MNIILIGISGCGKTSTGSFLAKKIKYNFIDTDDYISKKLDCKITDIFSTLGETYFRNQENLCLKEVISNSKHKTILSLGGGTFCSENIPICKNFGTTLWINTALEIIIKRLNNTNLSTRPLLKNNHLEEKLNSLLMQRQEYYQQADFTLQINQEISLENLTNQIIDLLKL